MSLILIPDTLAPDALEPERARLRLRAAGVAWSTDANEATSPPAPTFSLDVMPAQPSATPMFLP